MTLRASFPAVLFFCLLFGINACKNSPQPDSCCIFSDVSDDLKAGQGLLQVEGSTSSYYDVFDDTGKQVAHTPLNETLSLNEGRYQVKVNNAVHFVEVAAGMLSKCATGTLIIYGNNTDYYQVIDSSNHPMVQAALGKPTSFFPGTFTIKVNNTTLPITVKLKELVEIRTGTLVVRGSTDEYYYVLDDSNKQLNYSTLEKPLAFLPGTYYLKVNNTSRKADVYAGQITQLSTGNLLVKGLTEEYYYVTDTLGNALNYQNLNKPLALFPGSFHVKVNNTLMNGKVLENKTTEFRTGSLMLTGGGTGYYYVLDETGNQLHYNSLNKSLSLFPSEYTVRLGSITRKATVVPGELTSLNAF